MQITSYIREPHVISWGGGRCTSLEQSSTESHSYFTLISNFIEFFPLGNGEGDVMYAEEILQPHLKAFPKVSYSAELHKSRKEPEKYSSRLLGWSLIAPYLILGKSCYPSPSKSALS